MGLPGAGKTTLADKLAPLINGERINADEVRRKANDWDFSMEGGLRQSKRMRDLAQNLLAQGKFVVADFVCPTEETRKAFGPDYTVWMDTITASEYKDTNTLFENPVNCNYHVKKWFTDTHAQLSEVVLNYMERNNVR